MDWPEYFGRLALSGLSGFIKPLTLYFLSVL